MYIRIGHREIRYEVRVKLDCMLNYVKYSRSYALLRS
jgi:hypothetical protein